MEEEKIKELMIKSLKMARNYLREGAMDYGCDGNAFIIGKVACKIFDVLSETKKK